MPSRVNSDRGLSAVLPDSIPPIFVVGVALAIVAFVVFALIMPNCSRGNDRRAATVSDQVVDDGQTAQALASDFTPNADEPHQAKLLPLLGEDGTIELLSAAATNPDVLWIAAHADKYSFDGMEAQAKALKLAATESEAVPFVRSYPTEYPLAAPRSDESLAMSSDSPSQDVPGTNIPHLYQWDQRWANTGFAGSAFGLTGDGPTCLAMVRQGLTGDASKTPYDIGTAAQHAENAVTDKQGLKAEYLFDGAADLGLQCSQLYPNYDVIRDTLLAGQPIILVVEPGHFSNTANYVVLTGIAGNNQAVMNDPSSAERSSRLWNIDELVSHAETMYVYSV